MSVWDEINAIKNKLDDRKPETVGSWVKITATTVTTADGTEDGAVADLQVAHDGLFYHVVETAGDPFTTIIDFVSVTAFNWVNIIASYDGSATHSVAVQLYNFAETRWDTFDSAPHHFLDVTTADAYIIGNHDFFVPSDTAYIGTGGDAGKVRVRFAHSPAGVNGHDLYIDVVALYQ